MSVQNIHGDSLLSNISNISVKIDNTQIDDPVFLHCVYGKQCEERELECEVPIEMIEQNQQIDQGSLMERVYLRCKQQLNGHEQHQQVQAWLAVREIQGMSQDVSQAKEKQKSQGQSVAKVKKPKKHSQSAQLGTQQNRNLAEIQNEKLMKNETKNIPKNYGKAIITFIQKYKDKVIAILQSQGVDYDEFLFELKDRKKVINTIADLRSMWLDYKYAKSMRLLSNLFLRRYSLSYIFNSRICNYSSHIKYRYRLAEAIKHPHSFKHIKDY